jgi:hypothetical protein
MGAIHLLLKSVAEKGVKKFYEEIESFAHREVQADFEGPAEALLFEDLRVRLRLELSTSSWAGASGAARVSLYGLGLGNLKPETSLSSCADF